jgi:hypothetical protein
MMKRGRAATIIKEVQAAVQDWPAFATAANVGDAWQEKIRGTHRFAFPVA